MFKKLYRTLLLQNIGILSLLLFIVFASLYVSTYFDINNRIDFELNKVLQSYSTSQNNGPDVFRFDRSNFFVVEVNQDGSITSTESQIMIEPSTVTNLVEGAKSDEGTVRYDERTWNYISIEDGDTTVIAFMNTTIEHELLNSTLVRFSLIFLLSIAITWMISSYITKKSITPVKESFDKQKQFVSDASHELKTPLTVIGTNVDILISEDKENNKWLRYIKDEVGRMSKLTHDLLYLSKMTETDKKEIIQSKFNASDTIESISLSVEALAYEKGINLKSNIEKDIEVTFNKEQFHQIAMILVDNAIKYANKDGDIEVSLEKQSNHILLSVSNTGKGIPQEDIKHIFDRFYKVDKSREVNSNSFGLGLPIAKSICENNSAKLLVTSEENGLTTFIIKLKTT